MSFFYLPREPRTANVFPLFVCHTCPEQLILLLSADILYLLATRAKNSSYPLFVGHTCIEQLNELIFFICLPHLPTTADILYLSATRAWNSRYPLFVCHTCLEQLKSFICLLFMPRTVSILRCLPHMAAL